MQGRGTGEGRGVSYSTQSGPLGCSLRKQIIVVDIFSRNDLVPHRDARSMNGLGVPGNEGMPPRKAPPFGETDVGAGAGQPVHVPDIFRGNPDTVRAGPQRCRYTVHLQSRMSRKEQATDVSCTSPVSSSLIFSRQQMPQPSQRDRDAYDGTHQLWPVLGLSRGWRTLVVRGI